jgi:hypothetical protein
MKPNSRHRSVIAGAVLAAIAAGLPSAAAAACPPDAAAAMAALGVDPAKIARSQVETVLTTTDDPRPTGYRLWLRAPQCRGSLVVDFDLACRPLGHYTRGGCSLPQLQK